MIKFSLQNTKTRKLSKHRLARRWLKDRKLYSFDLLSGWSCPFALECKSKVVQTKKGLRVRDSPQCSFRCFATSQEVLYTSVYRLRKRNFNGVRNLDRLQVFKKLQKALPVDVGIVRLHVGGDFFSQAYFDGWVDLAQSRPNILFYGYTKAIGYWRNRLQIINSNLVLTASKGGTQDYLIGNLPYVKVVQSTYEARQLKLPVDHNDSHAAFYRSNFAIVIHGIQPSR